MKITVCDSSEAAEALWEEQSAKGFDAEVITTAGKWAVKLRSTRPTVERAERWQAGLDQFYRIRAMWAYTHEPDGDAAA